MVQVREINDIQELGDVRPSWNSLWRQTARATFFQSLDWLECYWRHFGREQRLRALVVYDGQQRPTGILPLVVRREATRVGTIRVLTYPLHDWGFTAPSGRTRPRRCGPAWSTSAARPATGTWWISVGSTRKTPARGVRSRRCGALVGGRGARFGRKRR